MELGKITLTELRKAIKALRANKAAGPDGHPMEFWRCLVHCADVESSEGASWLLELCNLTWTGKVVPRDWQLQRVALLEKRGPRPLLELPPNLPTELGVQDLRNGLVTAPSTSRY